ncbi:hypothetical protein [Oscillibacter sp. 1-3]|uniref:hypothetical protein n=1 Tax=Oscillibacter sp. 1-3 TaxID=1235797 RepID=UPI001FA75BE6|nr:hypothetical protein [Oscillibacter sp. 1-3]
MQAVITDDVRIISNEIYRPDCSAGTPLTSIATHAAAETFSRLIFSENGFLYEVFTSDGKSCKMRKIPEEEVSFNRGLVPPIFFPA